MSAGDAWTAGAFDPGAFDTDTFQIQISTTVGITLGGVDVRDRMRQYGGPQIRDILNDAPNTCTFAVDGVPPLVGQRLRITLSGGDLVLFAGRVQTVDQTFEGQPQHVVWRCSAIDDTWEANARRPFGSWVSTSATTIAQAITPAGFSTAGIVAGLPAVTIIFDGSATFIACLTQLATAIGGYCKVEDLVVYLFFEDTTDPPDPIDADHRFLHDPPITIATDASQLRTRVYGKGYGEQVPTDLSAGETLIPLLDGSLFSATGGQAIIGTTADGAQSQRLTYTGLQLATAGSVVGPGATPPTAPGVELASGTGVESGAHKYAYVFVTAAGRSRPSPGTTITVGALPAPMGTPLAAAPTVGTGPDDGVHQYALTFVTAAGETTAGPRVSVTTTSELLAPPPQQPGLSTNAFQQAVGASGIWAPGDSIAMAFAWEMAGGSTTIGPVSDPILAVEQYLNPGMAAVIQTLVPPSPLPGVVTAGYVYIKKNGVWVGYYRLGAAHLNQYWLLGWSPGSGEATFVAGPTPPSTNTARRRFQVVPLSGLEVPTSPLVTAKKLYGTAAGSTQLKLITSLALATTTASVTTPDASLGANVPTTNTAAANRVTVAWPVGPSGVTDIELFRTPIGSAVYKKFYTVGSNTAGTTTDSTPDASLTTPAPSSDTSGLAQPAGQVDAGSTSMLVASTAAFFDTGGWVRVGQQVIRYLGVDGGPALADGTPRTIGAPSRNLIGIPASGPGAILTTIPYGAAVTPAPMLRGVSGLAVAAARGTSVHVWVQRDDLAAQAEHAARTGGDGIVEYHLVDERRAAPSLAAMADADLARFSRPLVTVTYATHDLKSKSGKTVTINLASPAVSETLTIQEVAISAIDRVPGLPPRFTVTASSVRFSLEDTLRQLIVK